MPPSARNASVASVLARRRRKPAPGARPIAPRGVNYLIGLNRRSLDCLDPSDLAAAALAGSFSIALADEMSKAILMAAKIDTTATVTREHGRGGWTITRVHLDVVAALPQAAQSAFIEAALQAKASCCICRLLNLKVSMRAKLQRTEKQPHASTKRTARRLPRTRPILVA